MKVLPNREGKAFQEAGGSAGQCGGSLLALLHGLKWAASVDNYLVAPGISLHAVDGTAIGRLYNQLCVKEGIDDGEPFGYEVCVRFQPTDEEPHFLNFGDPYSAVDRLSNVLAIVTGRPVGMCRAIWSQGDSESVQRTELVYTIRGQTEFLEGTWPDLSDRTLRDVSTAWNNQQLAWRHAKGKSRVVNALTYFYYAWQSHYADQICLNLAIVLELVFAPHSQSETTHQIAYNLSRFYGESRLERERIYRFTKRFYRYRSKVVHGGIPDDGALIGAVVEGFPLVAGVLRKILTNEILLLKIDDDEARKGMLDEFLFE